jgi:hypothetical protein
MFAWLYINVFFLFVIYYDSQRDFVKPKKIIINFLPIHEFYGIVRQGAHLYLVLVLTV